MQLFGNSAGAQAGWYIIVIALTGAYSYFYWRRYIRKKKRADDSFDPSPFEDQPQDELATYETYRPVNAAAMSDNDLGTYQSEYYDPVEGGFDEHGARVGRPPTAAALTAGRRYDLSQPATVTAVRPPTAAPRPQTSGPRPPTSAAPPPATTAGRRYDVPGIPGPYAPTEPLRPTMQAQADPFRDPARPRTGVPYPVSIVSHEDFPEPDQAPPYTPPHQPI